MLKEFDVIKIEKQLKKTTKDNGIDNLSAVQIVVNLMMLYNDLITGYNAGDLKKVYILYQISGQIFNQLKVFGIYPDSKLAEKSEKEEYIFNAVKKNVEKR